MLRQNIAMSVTSVKHPSIYPGKKWSLKFLTIIPFSYRFRRVIMRCSAKAIGSDIFHDGDILFNRATLVNKVGYTNTGVICVVM